MCNSNRVGIDVNTQFFWCVDGPPSGFWTSVPILCRVTVYNLPVGTELFFDIDAVWLVGCGVSVCTGVYFPVGRR